MEYEDTTPQEVYKWFLNEDIVLIDVREPFEYERGHLDGAKLHPLNQVNPTDIPKTSKKIVLYCHRGQRSAIACVNLKNDGEAQQLYNLEGGILAWAQAGLPLKA